MGTLELQKFHTKIQWQINRRALIQYLLFDLHSFLEQHSEFWQTADDYWHALNRMAAIGFSLWRAAFLTDVSGSREQIQKQTLEFVDRVLKYNAITFADDYRMSELTMLYYNNNARYRLERMLRHNEDLAQLASFQRIEELAGHNAGDMEKLDQQGLWDDLFTALYDCFEAFRTKWQDEIRPPYKPLPRSKAIVPPANSG